MTKCARFNLCNMPAGHEGQCSAHPVVVVNYKNWKGNLRTRKVVPSGQMMYGSNPPWHPKDQWLIGVIDCEDGRHKFFAMDGFTLWKEVHD